MKKNNLDSMKKRLTVIFTLLVFFIAVFLEFVFFSTKYYAYISEEKQNFNLVTSSIENRFISINDFITTFDVGKRLFKLRQGQKLQKGLGNEESFVSLLVIDKNSRNLIFNNVVEDVSVSFIEKQLEEDDYNKIDQENRYLIKKIQLKDIFSEYDVIFIKNLRYSFIDYLRDLSGFILLTFLFSALLYYIGYQFVNKNLEPLEQNLKDMQDFIHNAGHELKTPISVIISNLQLLHELKKYDKNLTKESIDEIKRLNKLIDGLVELSDINITSKKQDLNLEEEINAIIKDYNKEIEKKEIDVGFNVKSNFKLSANREYFYIFFGNLLANAVKYNKKGGNIKVELNKNKLIIEDSGIGIKDEDKEKIWDRFYQADKSRNSKGFGIGLSLVQNIAKMYKWTIKVSSKVGDGTKIEISF
ncbi:MAG: HAMP domain-containing sensor histidine kinase [Candidatus Gracilibacteria bacterium]|nr:HAMP domain-containing sensor histidine kinase [Candidatus Gracilibacteria bacterium]